MPEQQKPLIYEVSLTIKPEILAEFDVWLNDHVTDMLALPGFMSAEIFTPDGTAVPPRRVVQYRLESRQALDSYLADHASRMREEGLARFGSDFSAERRILALNALENQPASVCANCSSTLVTHYCANCGQEAKDYHISFWRLMHDFMGDNFNFDSRFVNSLKPLFLKPGQLTQEYMNGWRARHIPPLRLYLLISLVFFALFAASIDTNTVQEFQPPYQDVDDSDTQEKVDEVINDLDEKNIIFGVADGAHADQQLSEKDIQAQKNNPSKVGEPQSEMSDLDNYFREHLRQYENNWAELAEDLLGKLPIVMFLMLPIYAFLLKLLYVFRKRYYMEHLIFAFHVHAFTFLVFIGLEIWSNWLGPWVGVSLNGWFIAAITLWLMLYPWFAMRRNYGQGWWLTTLKYLVLGTLYFYVLTGGVLLAIMAAVFV